MADPADVPVEILTALRSVCLRLPEAYEEQAWTGTRWRVGRRTFAHVVLVDSGWPPAYARAVGADGPVVVLTFTSSGPELDALSAAGPPFFKPPWRSDVVGMALGPDADWDEVAELVTESYRAEAPSRLAPN